MIRSLRVPAGLVLRSLVLGVALATGAALTLPAHAAAPVVKTQAPGWFRMTLGQFEVTALNDGTIDLPVDQLLKQPAAATKQAVEGRFQHLPTETSVNAFLVNTGSRLVLVDTGAGSLFGPTVGGLVNNLKAAGYQPEQVDDIVITHMHGDHIGGLTANGQAVFPKAVVHADQHDIDYWLSAAEMDKAPADKKDFFKGAMAVFEPYQKAGRLQPIKGDGEIVPGLRSMAAYGHTPGHTVYVAESQGHRLVMIGDLIHVAAVQMPHPEVTITFDSDPNAARSSRAKVFAQAAREGDWVAAAHLSFPGVGHLKAAGKGWQWVPVDWTMNR